jgi:glycosyltransferase 2 family protein
VAVSVGLLWFLFGRFQAGELGAALRGADCWKVCGGIAFLLGARLCEAAVLSLTSRALRVSISVARAWWGGALASCYGFVLPGDLMGSAASWSYYSMVTRQPAEVLAILVVNRALFLCAWVILAGMAWVLVAGALSMGGLGLVVLAAGVAAGIYAMGWLLLQVDFGSLLRRLARVVAGRWSRGAAMLRLAAERVAAYQIHRGLRLVPTCLWIGAVIATNLVGLVLLAGGLGANVRVEDLAMLFAVVGLARSLPISIHGFGIRESLSVLLLARTGVGAATATMLGLLMGLGVIVYAALGACYQGWLLLGVSKRH